MSDIPLKKCTGPCGQEYPATTEYWHKQKAGKYGLYAKCKVCTQEYKKGHCLRPDIKEYRKEYGKEYRSRPFVKQHRKELKKEYHSRLGVKESVQKYHKEHYAKNKQLYRIQVQARRARKLAIGGSYTHEQIADQLKRQKHKCYYCQKRLQKSKGKYIYHIDHTFPLSRVAGMDIPANSIDYIVLSCPTCNLSKHDKFPWEWSEGGRLF